MNKISVAKELASIARDLVGAKFDTKKELDEYKRTHGQRPGTRLQVRNKQEMQKRYKTKKAVAIDLIAMAKSLVAKTYPVILDKPEWNKKLWLDIQGVAYDIFHMADEDDEGSKSSALAKSKARELAGKYVSYSAVPRHELEKTILEMIWEEYHAGI